MHTERLQATATQLAQTRPAGGEDRSRARLAFEVFHRVLGYGALGLGAAAALSGIHRAEILGHIDGVAAWNAAVVAPLAAAAAAALGIAAYLRLRKPPPPEEKTMA